ncbi:MAG TPA: PadR family transcriptional regulator [Stellaceae bacterium]|nr:PadR family transcriptional regulator [Stellaceae bacterium]
MHHRAHRDCHERRFARDEFGFRGRHFGGRHHGRGGGRVFDHGDLRLVILQLIGEKPSYGYEIIKAIEEKLAGAYSPSPGVVYPTLTMLEELGYARVSASEGGKKLYEITPEGSGFLEANKAAVAAVLQRIAEVNAARGGGPAPQILRAMENLRMALRMRLARGPLSDEQIRRVTASLDGAAIEIEQS